MEYWTSLLPHIVVTLMVVGVLLFGAISVLDAQRRTEGMPKWQYLLKETANLTADRDKLHADIGILKAELGELNITKADLEIIKEQVQLEAAKLESVQDRYQNLASQRAEIEEVESQLTKILTDRATAIQEKSDAEARLSELRPEIDLLSIRQTQLTEELSVGSAKLDQLNSNLYGVQAELDSASRKLDSDRRDLSVIQEETRRLSELLSDVRHQHDGLSVEIASLEGDRTRVQAQIESANGSLAELNERRNQISGDVGRLSSERDGISQALRAEQADLAEVKGQVDSLRNQRDSLKGEVNQLNAALASLRGKFKPPTEEDEKDNDSLSDLLQVPDILLAATKSISFPSEEKALAMVSEYLVDQGLDFSPRLLHAFHTALKISDISPITVLAGISGTGKSELPRQYAQAIGIPFLQLAVQPRCDSPQDLFGFYNYMEQRYKPTELIRAMIHMDEANWGARAEPYRDHIALVLLDEMNLARVEYYFSEFLSRLEVRRDRDDLPAANIDLDLGHLTGGRRNKVYPVRRLLFVGTMNEDESTQSLSDKVVDRANVMRFPRPAKLASGQAKVRNHDASNFLPFSVWRSWHRGDTLPAQVDDWLITLNGYLEELGRPFGHRMGRAIRAYVSNHPETRQGRTEIAMADQLEMRLFPKLRGIDPQADNNSRALDSFESFITTTLKDEPLLKAFAKARNRDLFLWGGVDRSRP